MRSINAAVFLSIVLFVGCQTTGGNVGQLQSYSTPAVEAEWIRSGEPIEFEEELWYPADSIEGFLDSEMMMVGAYRDVKFFVDKVDVRPYNRLYTKFGRNQFRFFERRDEE
ncbi:MAG TPA: hypothetical protein PKV41_00015 [Candidatus Omnitrophota bacterium]|nr:hypothetical protein [Candidatus Omnitrophota bacterium]